MARPVTYIARILIVLAGLTVVATVLPWLADLYFGPEALRRGAAEALGTLLSRQVSITGRAAVTLFPRPSLVIEDIAVANPEGFAGDMVAISRARLDFRIVSVLARQLELSQLTLSGVRVTVLRDQNGALNWRDFGAGVLDVPKDKERVQPVPGMAMDHSRMNWRVSGGEIVIKDNKRGLELTLNGLGLELTPKGEVRLHTVAPGLPGGLGAEISLSGTAVHAPREGFSLDRGKVSLSLLEKGHKPDARPLASLEAELSIARDGDLIGLGEAKVELPGATLSGQAELSGLFAPGRPRLQARVASPAADLDAFLAALSRTVGAGGIAPDAIDAGIDLALGKLSFAGLELGQVAATAALTQGGLRLAPASARLPGGEFKLEAGLSWPAEAVELTCAFESVPGATGKAVAATFKGKLGPEGGGRLEVSELRFSEMAKLLGYQSASGAGAAALSLAANLAWKPGAGEGGGLALDLGEAEVKWPDAEVRGKAQLALPVLSGLSLAGAASSLRGTIDAVVQWDRQKSADKAAQDVSPGTKAATKPAAQAQGKAQPPGSKPAPPVAGQVMPFVPTPKSGTAPAREDARAAQEKPGPGHPAAAAKPAPAPKAAVKLTFTPRPGDAKAAKPQLAYDVQVQAGLDDIPSLGMVRAEASGQLGYDQQAESWRFKAAKIEGRAETSPGFPPRAPLLKTTFAGQMSLDLSKGVLDFSPCALSFPFAKAEGHLSATGLWGETRLWGAFQSGGFSPRQALAALGVTLPAHLPQAALNKAALGLEFVREGKTLIVSNLKGSLDATNLTGRAEIDLGTGRTVSELGADEIDLDNYLETVPQGSAKSLTGQGREPDKPFALDFLRELSVQASLKATWLRRTGLVFKNPLISFTGKDGHFRGEMRCADFYGGGFTAAITGQVQEQLLSSCVDFRIDDLSSGPFLRDLTGEEVITGRGGVSVNICGHGRTEAAWWRAASGSAALVARSGVMGGQGKDKKGKPAETIEFSVMGASFAVKDGVATTGDLIIDGPRFKADGKGWINLASETLDLSLSARYDGSSRIPVGIKGAILDPAVDIDRTAVLSDTVYRLIEGVVRTPEFTYKKLRNFLF